MSSLRRRAVFASLAAGIAFFLLAVVLFVIWFTFHPDSSATFYCTLGDQNNYAIVQQEEINRLVVYYAMVTAGLLSLISWCAWLVCRVF